jgi:hypothetical protein
MTERHRSKIANSQILNRLISYCEGKEGVKMSPAQVTGSLGLLKKVMPDLASIENTGETQTTYVIRAPEPVRLAADWERQNAPALLTSATTGPTEH